MMKNYPTNNSTTITSPPLIDSLDSAVRYFIRVCLKGRAQTMGHVSGAKGPICYRVRHLRVTQFGDTVEDFYQVYFKREWFRSFSYIFNLRGYGVGQTFNMRALMKAAANNDTIVFVMPDAKVYTIPVQLCMSFIERHGTTRIPKAEREEEGSIPASLLTRFGSPVSVVSASSRDDDDDGTGGGGQGGYDRRDDDGSSSGGGSTSVDDDDEDESKTRDVTDDDMPPSSKLTESSLDSFFSK